MFLCEILIHKSFLSQKFAAIMELRSCIVETTVYVGLALLTCFGMASQILISF